MTDRTYYSCGECGATEFQVGAEKREVFLVCSKCRTEYHIKPVKKFERIIKTEIKTQEVLVK